MWNVEYPRVNNVAPINKFMKQRALSHVSLQAGVHISRDEKKPEPHTRFNRPGDRETDKRSFLLYRCP